MDYQHIQVSQPGPHLVCVTLNRPEAANALNTALAEEFAHVLDSIKTSSARALIITGAGTRAFSAGADLKERVGMDRAAWDVQHHAFETAFEKLAALEIPVIAAVNGAAIAGGLELALACDLIVASANASFAFKEASLGIMPGLGGTARLPRAIGSRAALEMLLTSETINAEKALSLGLVNHVSDDVMADALKLAEKIAAAAPLSVKAIKKAVRDGGELPLKDALKLEHHLYGTLIDKEDRIEGITAFNEKRKPKFKSR